MTEDILALKIFSITIFAMIGVMMIWDRGE